MSLDWLSNDLWRAHVSWISSRWVEATEDGQNDFDPVRWLDQIQSAHYQTLIFYAKFHEGYCTFPSRLSDYCAKRDFLGECMAEARQRGMRVVIYYSAFIDQAAGNKHPDWQVKATGWQAREELARPALARLLLLPELRIPRLHARTAYGTVPELPAGWHLVGCIRTPHV